MESNHGRYGGNVLDADGVAQPGIHGIALDGNNGTARILDTDAGELDNDRVYDRAVGPMQFIPSTWAVVGVDGDGDGERNPQDIDDAALATAVYLCSGDEDLANRDGQESAVFRYNRSNSYVQLVLSIMDAYAGGDYTSVPTSSSEPVTFTPSYGDSVFTTGTTGQPKQPPKQGPTGTSTPNGGVTPTSPQDPGTTPTTPTSPDSPSNPPGNNVGTKDPGKVVKDTVDDVKETVKDTLTPLEEATKYCLENLTGKQLDALGGLSKCTGAYLEGGAGAVKGLLDGLLGTIGGLLGGKN